MREILELQEVGSDDLQLVGMAGAMLAGISNAKIPTPRAFIVTTGAYDLFLEHNSVKKDIEALLAAGNYSRVSEVIGNCLLPGSLVAMVSKAYTALSMNREMIVPVKKELTVSVQPSPVSGLEMPHAMQSASDPAGLVSAVIRCWSSLYSEENIKRMDGQGISPKDERIAVLVQSILRSEKTGSAMVSGGAVDIDASWGVMPPTDIISVPDHYRIDKESRAIKEKRIGNQKRMYKMIQGKLSEVPVPRGMNDQQKLIDHEIHQVMAQALRVERQIQAPVELGWVKFVKEILITRARLIGETRAPAPAPSQIAVPAGAEAPKAVIVQEKEITAQAGAEAQIAQAELPPAVQLPPAIPVPPIMQEQPKIEEPPAIVRVTIPEHAPQPMAHKHEPEGIEPVPEQATQIQAAAEPLAQTPPSHPSAPIERAENIEKIEEVPIARGLDAVKDDFPELPESPAEDIREVRDELFDVPGTKIFSFVSSGDIQGELRNDIDGLGLLDVSAIQNADEKYESIKQILGLYHPKEVWVLVSVGNAEDIAMLERLRAEGYGNAGALLSGVVDAVQIPVSTVPLGVLIETPACGISIEAISRRVAFANIDIQAVTDLALNRAEGFDESSPAVVELIRHAISTCRKNKARVGAILASQRLLPLLIGDGIGSVTVQQDGLDSFRAEILREEKRLILEKLRR